ncbi:hypothetical protein [Sphingomicrobium marinum]|uniref:hypothetical protein n=1 Tax=Sphingomicrobium marinum TaxID=1227950 RepID=UPI00223F49DC|nr:hypothetical protein [Sphingomicrobium marinum]
MIGLAISAMVVQPVVEPQPLFESDAVLNVTIAGPFSRLVRRAKRNPEPYAVRVTVNGIVHDGTIEARGLTRRVGGFCTFPPLRLRFPTKPDGASPFAGQNELKMVTHCQDKGNYEQVMLREYAAYRLYNVMTDESLRVRLANIRYENESGSEVATRMGFFIEDIDAAADRLGGTEINLPAIGSRWVGQQRAARYALFQYMIGNLDWSMFRGPQGRDCCHNSKVIGPDKQARQDLIPIPYDFDMSGWVDAPYAIAPEGLPVRNVRQRLYRGLCRYGPDTLTLAADLRGRRPEFTAAYRNVPGISDSTRRDLDRYLDDFFSDISTDAQVRDKVLDDCR